MLPLGLLIGEAAPAKQEAFGLGGGISGCEHVRFLFRRRGKIPTSSTNGQVVGMINVSE